MNELRDGKFDDERREHKSAYNQSYHANRRNTAEYRAKRRIEAHTYYHANKERILARTRELNSKNLDKIKARRRAYRRANRDKINQYDREYRKRNPTYLISERLRASLSQALKKANIRKSTKTFDLIGCTPQFLRAYLEERFLPGMSWDRRSEIHIDHIRPIDSFDLTDPEQVKACFHYTNLQPLWAEDNLKKGATYEEPIAA